MAKIEILTVLGLYSHISAPINMNFTFIWATCCPCGAKNPFFGPLSKNNSGMAALRAGLPVIIIIIIIIIIL